MIYIYIYTHLCIYIYMYIYIYIYIYSCLTSCRPPATAPRGGTLSQRSTEVPLRRTALSVCPCGDAWGTPLQLEIR